MDHIQSGSNGSSASSLKRRYRLLAYEELSVSVEASEPIAVGIAGHPCRFALEPAYKDPGKQRLRGGTWIHVEFQSDEEDLLLAAGEGHSLVEDFLAGLTLVTGIPFKGTSVVQIANTTESDQTEFLIFISPTSLHADRPIRAEDVKHVKKLLAHWDGLETGTRIRRAARMYQRLMEHEDDLTAFQFAYIGLEAIEPPLASQLGVTAGAEEVRDSCGNCGAEYVYRRSVLNGVRSYVTGSTHPDNAHPGRIEEWKAMNKLRNNLIHGLKDLGELRKEAQHVLPATAHNLHDGVCCLSHAHDLESSEYVLERGARKGLLRGYMTPGLLDSLEDAGPLLGIDIEDWVPHPKYGFVPSYEMDKHRKEDMKVAMFWLLKPLGIATMEDLEPGEIEVE